MKVFKERAYVCVVCEAHHQGLYWEDQQPTTCRCGGQLDSASLRSHKAPGVIDDQLEGATPGERGKGRWCETMGHEPVWLDGTKSDWKRKVAERPNIVHVDRHDRDYYKRMFKQHDEQLRDTGQK